MIAITIARKMLKHIQSAGFVVIAVWDGEETVKVNSIGEAMKVVESVDLSNVIFERKENDGTIVRPLVALILSNEEDVISDWTIRSSKFNEAMTEFCDSLDAE